MLSRSKHLFFIQMQNNYTKKLFLNSILCVFLKLKIGYFLNHGFFKKKFMLTGSVENGILIKIFSFHFIEGLISINPLAEK